MFVSEFVEPKLPPVVDLSKPSVLGLAYLLRHRELWPTDFVFDFADCPTCAMGLAVKFWRLDVSRPESSYSGRVCAALRIPRHVAFNIFVLRMEQDGNAPEDIARDLDSFADNPGAWELS